MTRRSSQPFITSIAEETGWSEGEIIVFCGAVVGSVCVVALITALRAVDVVLDALPPARRAGVHPG